MFKVIQFSANVLLHLFLLLFSNVVIGQGFKLNEREQLFDYDWRFTRGDFPSAKNFDFDDVKWHKLDLPHDWSIEGSIDKKNPSGGDGGYFPTGIGWYRKIFNVPTDWRNKVVSIYFEGVYMNSEVFINGISVGIWPYGYSSFGYDITPHLKFGERNIVAVRVDNSKQKNSRWYTGSGIYRHVKLFVKNNVNISNWGVAITTPEVNANSAKVQVKTIIKNESNIPREFEISTTLSNSAIKNAGSALTNEILPANSQKEFVQILSVKKPSLWSTMTPSLYNADIVLKESGKISDRVSQKFGIRSIEFSTTKGFQLNGKTMKLNGGCVHHDNGCLGAAAYDRAEERKVELLKTAGFNAVRTAHNPPSEAFLDACDRLGLLVIDESFDGWREKKNTYDYSMYFDKWWQKDIESMVLRDRNHPSVIMWSTGNEVIERKKPEAVETAVKLVGHVRKLDNTRPVTSAMTTWDKNWEIFDPLFAVHDVGGYNYQLHRAISDNQRVPSRIIVQTESYPRDAFINWKLVKDNNYIIGDFVWTAIDYLGESGIGRYYYPGESKGEHYQGDHFPWHGAYCGDIDLTGWRKPISHYRNLLWNDNEKLYMAVKEPNPANGKIQETLWSVWPTWENWTWPKREGAEIEVEVYSKYPSVRLYLNGKLLEERTTGIQQEYKTIFKVPYTQGVLKAAGIVNGKEMQYSILRTAGKAKEINLKADRKILKSNGQDLCYVTVEILDENGIQQPNADNEMKFDIAGPGQIVGVENAHLKNTDPYVANKRKAWNGRAMVVIKSLRKEGIITLNVSSSGLKSAITKILAKK